MGCATSPSLLNGEILPSGQRLRRLLLLLRRPLRKSNLRRLSLRIDNWFALGINQHGLGSDVHVAAFQGLACQLNELLGVLWRIEHGR